MTRLFLSSQHCRIQEVSHPQTLALNCWMVANNHRQGSWVFWKSLGMVPTSKTFLKSHFIPIILCMTHTSMSMHAKLMHIHGTSRKLPTAFLIRSEYITSSYVSSLTYSNTSLSNVILCHVHLLLTPYSFYSSICFISSTRLAASIFAQSF